MPGFLRDKAFQAITSTKLDGLAPLRVSRDLARRLNLTLGQPLAPTDELAKRKAAKERLAAMRRGEVATSSTAKAKREAAPITVYFEKNRNQRELERVRQTLSARGFAWKELDVAGDEAAMTFVTRAASCDDDDLPIVFVADQVIGTSTALIEADVSGALAKVVFGS